MGEPVRNPVGVERRSCAACAALVLVAALAAACGGYSRRLEEVRVGVEAGDLETALAEIDTLILRGEADRSPENRDYPLLLLERSQIYQALGRHADAIADLTAADQILEVLDLSPDRAGSAAEYLWSGSKKLYRPPVYEKLMVNVLAASSFLASGDIRGAMVEARRILVLTDYFEGTDLWRHPMLGAAWYVAGLAFELGGDDDSAVRAYLDAFERQHAPGLAESIVRMVGQGPLAGDPRAEKARAWLGVEDADGVSEGPAQEVIVLAYSGLAPFREPEHLPVGLVFAWMRQNIAYSMGETRQSAYNRMLAEGLLTWVNFPVLAVHENPVRSIRVRAGDEVASMALVANVERFALEQWALDRPGIAWAAITRAITRVLAREAVQAAGRAGGEGTALETIGFLAGLATQGAMQAADVPDTRTWTMMPAYVWAARLPVEAGSVSVVVDGGPWAAPQVVEVEVEEGRSAVVAVRLFR